MRGEVSKLPSSNSFMSSETAREILRTLVLISSSTQSGKNEIIEHVGKHLKKLGFRCELLNKADSPAMIASNGAQGVLLSGHLDTVPIGSGWRVEQGETRGSLVYGRGAADMKGGCTAMLMAAGALQRDEIPVALALTTDEETGMSGAAAIADTKVVSLAPAIVVCEPTALRIGTREKGLLQLRIITHGRASHACMPEEGDNAIHKMVTIFNRLKSMTPVSSNEGEKMILNVNVIRGGEKVNVIPDHCEIEIDIRTPEELDQDDVLRMIRERIDEIDHDLEIMNRLRSVSTPEDAPIVKLISQLRPGAKICDIAFATEMVRYIEKNRNIAALGPGEAIQAHRVDEHIDLNQVVDAAKLYRELCLRIKSEAMV